MKDLVKSKILNEEEVDHFNVNPEDLIQLQCGCDSCDLCESGGFFWGSTGHSSCSC